MGCCASKRLVEEMDFVDSTPFSEKEFARQSHLSEQESARQVKILLLGAGESGKTTVLKAMKLLHTSGFDTMEREQYRQVIFTNLLVSMRLMLEGMEHLQLPLSDEESDVFIDLILEERELGQGQPFPAEYYPAFEQLWSDTGIQLVARRGNEFALHDNVHYFFRDLARFFKTDYVPTDQDILQCRLKTTGISETVFPQGHLTYRLFDVGGQRSERKKWIHCFENCTAILFLVAISGYDQCLVEDRLANQMSEALMLFDSICNSRWFISTSIILFLNKIDLFRIKLGYSQIDTFFPDFDPCQQFDAQASMMFFQRKFIALNRNTDKVVYSHFTNATDTTLLRSVMLSVADIILERNLQQMIL